MCKLTSASNAQPATSNICPRTGKCCSNCRTSARIEAQANGTSIALVLEQQTQKSAPEPTK